MQISIEGFLLDNLLMNWLMLRLASALSRLPLRRWMGWGGAMFGAVYALASMLWLPYLSTPVPKLLLGCLLACAMVYHWHDFPRAVLFLYLAACLMGGVMLCICIVLGGSMLQGALIGTLPMRAALIGAALCAALPRVFRSLGKRMVQRTLYVPLRIELSGISLQLSALVDSGNLLTDPISQRPIIIIRAGLIGIPPDSGKPIAFHSVGGSGILQAVEAKHISIFRQRWHAVDALIAESAASLGAADAIVPASLMPEERSGGYAKKNTGFDAASLPEVYSKVSGRDTVYTFGGDLTGPLSSRGGTGVDQAVDEWGTGSKECADRA